MPGKHDHDHKPKPHDGPPPRGPKERELAVALTVAVLGAANVSGTIDEVETLALKTYARMLDGIVGPREPLPPTVQF